MDVVAGDETTAQLEALQRWFKAHSRVVVAFSGGVDSTLVAKVAFDVLGAGATALTARSASLMPEELDDAVALAADIGITHEVVDTHEL
ncbi:MAG: asparagine synthase-related protein, partial [Myxococcota bacterium]